MSRLILFREVLARTKTARKKILAWVRAGQFPPPITLPDQRRLWRLSDVVEWIESLPRAEIGSKKAEKAGSKPLDESRLPDMAKDILVVLRARPGQWVKGLSLAMAIHEDVDAGSGHFRACCRLLREAGLIESSRSNGYRAATTQQ